MFVKKRIYYFSLMVCLLTACSNKKKAAPGFTDFDDKRDMERKEVQIFNGHMNADGDLLDDAQETQVDSNHLVADKPQVEVKEAHLLSLGLDFLTDDHRTILYTLEDSSKVDVTKKDQEHLRKKVINLVYKYIKKLPVDSKEKINDIDEHLKIVSNWKDHVFYNKKEELERLQKSHQLDASSGKLMTKYKLYLKNLKGIKKIASVKIDSFFYKSPLDYQKIDTVRLQKKVTDSSDEFFLIEGDDSFNPNQLYVLKLHSLPADELIKNINSRAEIAYAVSDYIIETVDGRQVRYANLMRNIKRNTAQIIFSTPKDTKVFNIVPRNKTIKECLESLVNNINFDEEKGEIYSIGDYESEISFNDEHLDIKNSSGVLMEKGTWIMFNGRKRVKITEKLKAGERYIVAFATVFELLHTQDTPIRVLKNRKIDDTYLLDKIHEGDVLEFTINGKKSVPKWTAKYLKKYEACYKKYREKPDRPDANLFNGPNTYRMPCSREVTVCNQPCEIMLRRFLGYETSYQKISDYRLYLMINDRKYKVDGSLPQHNKVAILDKNTFKLRFVATKEILDGSDNIVLKVFQDEKPLSTYVGNIGYGRCPARSKRGFFLTKKPPKQRKDVKNISYEYLVSLNIKGLPR